MNQNKIKREDSAHSFELLEYKNVAFLTNYISEVGMIIPRRIKKTSAAFQRKLSREIKRSRFLALMPYCDLHR